MFGRVGVFSSWVLVAGKLIYLRNGGGRGRRVYDKDGPCQGGPVSERLRGCHAAATRRRGVAVPVFAIARIGLMSSLVHCPCLVGFCLGGGRIGRSLQEEMMQKRFDPAMD